MKRNHIIALAAGVLSTSIIGFMVRNVEVIIASGSPSQPDEPLLIFDCPACGLPAEVAVKITEVTDLDQVVTNYIINCLGEHNKVAVTEQWLAENARAS